MNHLHLANLCQQSYAPAGIAGAEEIGGLGPKAFVLHGPTKVVIFRGTADMPGWMEDFFCQMVPHSFATFGRVHKGFMECWHELLARVRVAVKRKPCVITGHSLGGAIATLAAVDLHSSHVVTFGAPRVGDADFAENFAKLKGINITRYVHELDPVPVLPAWMAGYRHVCPPRWYHGGKFKDASIWAWLQAFIARQAHSHERLWADHAIVNYMAMLTDQAPPAAAPTVKPRKKQA